ALLASIRTDTGVAPERVQVAPAPSPEPSVAHAPEPVRSPPRRRSRAPVFAGLVVVGLAAFLPWLIDRSTRGSGPPAKAATDLPQVAILYFDDNSPQGGNEHIARGITETLIGHLGNIPNF